MLQSTPDAIVRDDQERGRGGDPESLGQVGSFVNVDASDREGFVVVASLEDLGNEPLDPSALTLSG
jgi:hypothetical protein